MNIRKLFITFLAALIFSLNPLSSNAADDSAAALDPSGVLNIPCMEVAGGFYQVKMALGNGSFHVQEVRPITQKTAWCSIYENDLKQVFVPLLFYAHEGFWAVLDVNVGTEVTTSVKDYGAAFQDILLSMTETDKQCYAAFNTLINENMNATEYEKAVREAEKHQDNSYCQAALSVAHAFARGVPEDVYRPECEGVSGIYAELNGCTNLHTNAEAAFDLASASAASDNVIGHYVKGMLYEFGIGTPQTWKHALESYLLSAVKGFPFAENSAGFFYEKGQWIDVDYPTAFKWFMLAALQGDLRGEYNVGWMYNNGFGVKQNYDTACRWYMLAAVQGYADGENMAGWCYENGYGVDQDYIDAYEWYMKASEHGNAYAMYNIGRMYEEGLGKWQSATAACSWYKTAYDNGYTGAQSAMDRVCN